MMHGFILTTFPAPEEEGKSVKLAKLKGRLQSIDGQGAVVPAVQLTHLLSYASITIHQNLCRKIDHAPYFIEDAGIATHTV